MQLWLRGAGRRSVRRSFVAGELCAIEATRAEASRERWPAAWSELDRPRARAWMGS
jgi:hypothetical protein